MNRRTVVRGCLVLVAVGLAIPCGLLAFWMAAASGSSSGSPALAAEWRDELRTYSGPDDADGKAEVVRFPEGEWVIGHSKNSHGIWYRGGGTVVVRDSRGQVRAFFGHVCVGNWLLHFREEENLDRFYYEVQVHLTEYHFAPRGE